VAHPLLDVVVLGGGPAGCAAALALARAGKSVALIEKTGYDGRRVGETLTPAARPLLTALGVWQPFLDAGHHPAPGLVSAWGSDVPNESKFIFNPYGHGWQLDRARFDGMLADAAAASGASIHRQHTIIACTCQPKHGWIIEAKGTDARLTLNARLVLDAAGRRTWPGRPARRRKIVDRLVAIVGYLACDIAALPDRRAWVESAPNGWWYSAPLPDQTLAAAYFTDSQLVARHGALSIQGWLRLAQSAPHTSRRIVSGYLTEPLRVVSAGSALATPMAAADWLAIGDAACAFDPLSGQGIYHALLTAIHAAHIIATSADCSVVGFEAYAREVTERFRRYLQIRNHYYQMEGRWPNEPFWRPFLEKRTERPRRRPRLPGWSGRS
jgi:flavin-dependent dehydrogenase